MFLILNNNISLLRMKYASSSSSFVISVPLKWDELNN